ncbi:hypothetical protein HGRIS_005368 [Hohenbuehelia grisea]|uniref:NACHT domain-containing protein n=1 Tax=Hohenbuehelia grisea TaxID=104357 RepID=A0ABR3JFK1_9AGAR
MVFIDSDNFKKLFRGFFGRLKTSKDDTSTVLSADNAKYRTIVQEGEGSRPMTAASPNVIDGHLSRPVPSIGVSSSTTVGLMNVRSPSTSPSTNPPSLPLGLDAHHNHGVCNINTGLGAQYVNSGAGQLFNVHGNQYNYHSHGHYNVLRDLKHAELAPYNADRAERSVATCLPGTRVGILANIKEWLENMDSSERVLWLKGSLGIGKTALAATIAQYAHDNGILAANFFFSRYDRTLRDPRLLFPTIAYQLAHHIPAMRPAIVDAVMATGDLAHVRPQSQFDALVRRTVQAIQHSERPLLFVFDGIDEFEDGIGSYQDIMHLFITELAQLSPNVRILVTSRPEPYIDVIMTTAHCCKVIDLDFNDEAYHDVEKYLRDGLGKIPEALCLWKSSDGQWFSEDQLTRLCRLAGASFVYASTALRFVADPIARDPHSQLLMLLESPSTSSLSHLDHMYLIVLQRAFPPDTEEAKLERLRAFLAILCFNHFCPTSLNVYVACLGCGPQALDTLLSSLHSIILVRRGKVQYYHSSLEDFLLDRCPDFRFRLTHSAYHAKFGHQSIEILDSYWGSKVIDETSISQPEFQFMHNWEPRDYVNEYIGCLWAAHISRVDPNDGNLVGLVRSFLQSVTFVGWLYQAIHCYWHPMSDLQTLCEWNCTLKGPVLAAMQRYPHIWKACQTDESGFAEFAGVVGLNTKETGGAFIEDKDMEQVDQCQCRRRCDLHVGYRR